MNDPIVEEVRRARDLHARKFNYDLAAICSDIRKHQAQCGHRIIRGAKPEIKVNKPLALDLANSPL